MTIPRTRPRSRSLPSVRLGRRQLWRWAARASLATLLPLLCLSLFGLSLFGASTALADATVDVRVRGPGGQSADATVTLRPEGGGAERRCTTSGGRCRIEGVPSGRYVVTAVPIGAGSPPPPRPVLIPPSGPVTVSVTLP